MREGDQSYILSIDVVDGKTVTPVPYTIAPRPVRCLGVAVNRVFTRTAEAKNLRLKRTRPFRPQTNGKAEAFNKIMQAEWAYQRPYYSTRERLDTLPRFLAYSNHWRPHGGIGVVTPASRLSTTSMGNYT